MLRLGIDVGGTNTDAALIDAPDDQSSARGPSGASPRAAGGSQSSIVAVSACVKSARLSATRDGPGGKG